MPATPPPPPGGVQSRVPWELPSYSGTSDPAVGGKTVGGRAERWRLALLLGKVKALYPQRSFEWEAHLARGKPSL
ncbi:hypothetical protein NDU88_007238 [Pleurodeles waltl]|uniref:Uncharacterized protein n=1 Tax=Pleurodeles waltl TaxID=8319 RepID=A0AAV7RPP8_PLEWA|nr:hypothetical protein NDU88_007238 [Pleurodeles waltl]